MRPRNTETTQEFLERLRRDPAYAEIQETQRARERRLGQLVEKIEAPILQDLSDVGIRVGSVWDFVNTRKSYAPAIPILMKHVTGPYPGVVLEGIARALAAQETKPHWEELMQLYRETGEGPNEWEIEGLPRGSLKDGLAVALAAMAEPRHFEEIVALLRDRSLGPSRVFFIHSVLRWKNSRRWEILEQLANDPDLKEEIAHRLKLRNMRKRAQ